MRVLDARNVTLREELHIAIHAGLGHRMLKWGEQIVADDGDGTLLRGARFALEAGSLTGKSIAWIGGGLCIGPRLFAIADCKQTVYEIEPALREFCPEGVEFVLGDWRDTISGKFDTVIFDLGGEIPRETLLKHLKPGGVILPKEDL